MKLVSLKIKLPKSCRDSYHERFRMPDKLGRDWRQAIYEQCNLTYDDPVPYPSMLPTNFRRV